MKQAGNDGAQGLSGDQSTWLLLKSFFGRGRRSINLHFFFFPLALHLPMLLGEQMSL